MLISKLMGCKNRRSFVKVENSNYINSYERLPKINLIKMIVWRRELFFYFLFSFFSLKFKAKEFMQNLFPVCVGPSLNKCPR